MIAKVRATSTETNFNCEPFFSVGKFPMDKKL